MSNIDIHVPPSIGTASGVVGEWETRERKGGHIHNQFELTPMRAPRLIQKNSIVYIPLNYNLKRGKHI